MKKIIILLALTVLLTSCTTKEQKSFSTLQDFTDTKISLNTGALFKEFINPVVPDVTYMELNSLADQLAALKANKVDALALDMPVAQLIALQQEDYMIFPETIAEDQYGFAVKKGSELAKNANKALDELRANGTLDEVSKLWFGSGVKKMPKLDHKADFDGSAGTIKYGLDTATEPMSYIGSEGTPLGFDLDVVSRIAYELNMKIEFVPMNFDSLLSALSSGKVDIVGGCMSITEERLESVDFIGPYYDGGIVLVIKKERYNEK